MKPRLMFGIIALAGVLCAGCSDLPVAFRGFWDPARDRVVYQQGDTSVVYNPGGEYSGRVSPNHWAVRIRGGGGCEQSNMGPAWTAELAIAACGLVRRTS